MRIVKSTPAQTEMNPQPLCFVTSSEFKVKEATLVLPFPVRQVQAELHEIQSTDLEQVVRDKAEQAWRIVKAPVIVEDTSLRFLAWRELPGPFIKHFIENLGLLGIVDALAPAKDWRAEAVTGVGYHDGENVHYFEGRASGLIVLPMGKEIFGWDAIFRPTGHGRTYAEMSREDKVSHSMRTQALRKLAAYLAETSSAVRI
jgi:non-canonical purine NTP pyrophosphatase (RdgB/HAM1 family)